jgi:hypothetical protein
MNWTADWISNYAPYIYFDKNEPFFPVRVGITVLEASGPSPSTRRTFEFNDPQLQYVIEYAIYWDYDIQHLYELEHVWVYVGRDGEVLDCDASYHGRHFKGLLRDRSNLEDGTHVRLYSQPGKHAFMPNPEMFYLLPDLMTATDELAGRRGLLVTGPFDGVYATDDETDKLVEQYLRTFRFKPAMEFEEYRLDPGLYATWPELHREVPLRIKERLAEIRTALGTPQPTEEASDHE